jgi:hypothetical protein
LSSKLAIRTDRHGAVLQQDYGGPGTDVLNGGQPRDIVIQ